MPNKTCKDHNHHLCQLQNQELPKRDPNAYAALVKNPSFVCKNCGRVAAGQENLCSPVKLGTWEE